MRIKHDDSCLWWRDWHSCSCGYLEEEIRNEQKAITGAFIAFQSTPSNKIFDLVKDVDIDLDESLECDLVIPGTFIMCGEGLGDERQYCSRACYNKAKGMK